MNREAFDTYWKSKGHTPDDTDFEAYQLGQRASEKLLRPTVETQQNKIADEIRRAGAPTQDPITSKSTAPTADHHPHHHYISWGEYRGNRTSMGYATSRAEYDTYLRSQGINTQSDHDITRQTTHSGGQGTGSISGSVPQHVHDQKQGASTAKGIPGGDPVKPTPPAPADTPPLPTQRTQPYTYPYKNLPFDPSRPPEEVGDPFYSTKYQEQLTRWSRDNWDRYQRKQPLIPKPLPSKETMAREREFLNSKQKTYDEIMKNTIKNTRFVPAKDVKVSIYTKQKPYYMEIKGVRQPGLYNIKGEKFDETGPKILDLGLLNKQERYENIEVGDDPEKIRQNAWDRGFDLGSVAAAWAGAAAKAGIVASQWGRQASVAVDRNIARNAARLRNLAKGSRAGKMSTRVTGTSREAGSRATGVSRGGLFRRPTGLAKGGPATAGRAPTRVGELPSGGGSRPVSDPFSSRGPGLDGPVGEDPIGFGL